MCVTGREDIWRKWKLDDTDVLDESNNKTQCGIESPCESRPWFITSKQTGWQSDDRDWYRNDTWYNNDSGDYLKDDPVYSITSSSLRERFTQTVWNVNYEDELLRFHDIHPRSDGDISTVMNEVDSGERTRTMETGPAFPLLFLLISHVGVVLRQLPQKNNTLNKSSSFEDSFSISDTYRRILFYDVNRHLPNRGRVTKECFSMVWKCVKSLYRGFIIDVCGFFLCNTSVYTPDVHSGRQRAHLQAVM